MHRYTDGVTISVMKKLILFLFFAFGLIACNSDGLESISLQEHGANIDIKMPAEAEISAAPLGLRKEITIKQDKFDVIILVADEVTQTAAEMKKEKLEKLKALDIFSKVIQEDDNGFIYEVNQGSGKNYDFRYIYIKNGTSHDFRRNFVGDYTLDEVKTMYNAVKQK